LWEELGQLGTAAALIRGDWAVPLSAAELTLLREWAPGVRVITFPGGGADVVATKPAAIAAAHRYIAAGRSVAERVSSSRGKRPTMSRSPSGSWSGTAWRTT